MVNKEEFDKHMEKLPFPEKVFEGLPPDKKEFFRKNWSGNPEKFLDNLEKELEIRTNVLKDGSIHITKRTDANP